MKSVMCSGREHLPGFGLLLVPVELVEEDAHDILSPPCVGVQTVGDLRHPVDKVRDQILDVLLFLLVLAVHVEVHADLGEHVREQTEFLVLVLVPQQLLVETVEDCVVEFGVVHAADHQRIVSFRDQCAGGEYHSVVEIPDTELEMQAVVDPGSQFVDALLVDVVDVEQGRVVGDVVELFTPLLLIFLAVLEHPGGFPVVEDAHDMLVFRIHDANVLQELLYLGCPE